MNKPNWNTANPKYYINLKEDINRLRSEMTEAEQVLWRELKTKKLGVKFRRHHMVDRFIPDFVSLPIKLIIEIDGPIHKYRKQYDERRTYELNELGYKVIRFRNEEIMNRLPDVLEEIKKEIEKQKGKNKR
ncbi:MAG: endonuclease domain-containing protein [Bacteroidales bacterium]|nr:endonuclease domain-containing protein [Bacteroidales bacterium]